jgi:hypothetical protein
MKKLLSELKKYGFVIPFMIIGVMAIIAGTNKSMSYDQRTYVTVLGGIMIYITFKMLDYAQESENKKEIKRQAELTKKQEQS